MPKLIQNPGQLSRAPIVPAGTTITDLCHFELHLLAKGEIATCRVPGYELIAVVLSGQADIFVGETKFSRVGGRPDIWSGKADSVYAGTTQTITLVGVADLTEIAVAGGKCEDDHSPFRISPESVDVVEVGSAETHSRRRIFHILGQHRSGTTGNLLVSELYADPGCWSGYPPHKHDTESAPDETDFQEVYHYRFAPDSGFGTQHCYGPGLESLSVRTRHRDTFLVDRGYHPTSTAPGHAGYIFTILVGRHQRSLIQFFEPEHRHLMSAIPGIQQMRDKFRC